jgi:MoxR-like ATPase
MRRTFETIERTIEELAAASYVADRDLATALYLAHHLQKPLFLEGEPGVGKTEVAIAVSRILDAKLIRLQCYEGLDASTALYEWNYPKQLLYIRMLEQSGTESEEIEQRLYSPEFLIQRPLLAAIAHSGTPAPVLLIDEIDRADEEFEAFLLELLADFQITIPEVGTVRAGHPPTVVVTSNRSREVHDALKRRCLYHWIDYPSPEREYRILKAKLPDVEDRLAEEITRFMQELRTTDFDRKPGVAETLDWARALVFMHAPFLDETMVAQTLGCILKNQEDLRRFREERSMRSGSGDLPRSPRGTGEPPG